MECGLFCNKNIVILHRIVGLSENKKLEFYKRRRKIAHGGGGCFTTEMGSV
jgi:hypothetical protein